MIKFQRFEQKTLRKHLKLSKKAPKKNKNIFIVLSSPQKTENQERLANQDMAKNNKNAQKNPKGHCLRIEKQKYGGTTLGI